MVQKSCKRGVNSGNTLRAFNTPFARQYRRQSVVVRKTFHARKTILRSKVETSAYHVSTNDVAFSLNKKGRWDLPDFIRQQLQCPSKSEVKVALLERHKLRKQANCVRFYSNKGQVKRLVPRGGRYFSKSVTDSEKVTKQKKRKKKLKRCVTDQTTTPEEKKVASSPEIWYEVFYPCPPTSSITHNPKYVLSQQTISDDIGKHKENGKPQKNRNKKRRVRLNLKDMKELWEEEEYYDESCDAISDQEEMATDNTNLISSSPVLTLLLEDLVDKALRERDKKYTEVNVNSRRSQKPDRKIHQGCSKKQKVIYINGDNEFRKIENEIETTTVVGVVSPLSFPVPILINPSETQPEMLSQRFGEKYTEAQCQPRKFSIDVTSMVQNLVRTSKFFRSVTSSSFDLSSYLVFVKVCSKKNELDVYNVSLNLKTTMRSLKIETMFDWMELSVDEIISRMLAYIETLPVESLVKQEPSLCRFTSPLVTFDLVKSTNKWNVESYHPDCHQVTGDYLNDDVILPRQTLYDDTPEFCNICFCEINNSDSVDTATSLKACGHWFCDGCWREHLITKLNSGTIKVVCPAYRCDVIVDRVTMLSFVNIRDIHLQEKRSVSIIVSSSPDKKWCPYPSCGRVLKTSCLVTDRAVEPSSLTCNCGTQLCIKCMKSAHWPATCKQAEEYKDRIIVNGDYIDLPWDDGWKSAFPDFQIVKGKPCPKCNRLVEKMGGCPMMSCSCGVLFCWKCLSEISRSVYRCECNGTEGVQDEKNFFLDSLDRTTLPTANQKARLYRLAVAHRRARRSDMVIKLQAGAFAMTKALVLLSNKSDVVRTQIEKYYPDISSTSTVRYQIASIIRSCIGTEQELHHVIEHTAISLDQGWTDASKLKISHVLSFLESVCLTINGYLEQRGPIKNTPKILPRLFLIQKQAKRAVTLLVNALTDC